MEKKSRFEVLKELNDKKEALLREKNGLNEQVLQKKKQIKADERIVEDQKEELVEFEKNIPEKQSYIDELIRATDASIESLQKINAQK